VVVELGFASAGAVEAAVKHARETGQLTGHVLIEDGVLTADQLARVLAERFGLDRVDLNAFKVDPAAAQAAGPGFSRRYDAVPIAFDEDGTMLVALADPTNLLALDDLAMLTGRQARPVVVSYEDIRRLKLQLAPDLPVEEEDDLELVDTSIETDVTQLHHDAADGPVVGLVHSILSRAIRRGASDIHFDPGTEDMVVRFRIDGEVMTEVTVPRRMSAGVVSRMKIMANLDIAERRVPQDGRSVVSIEGHEVDLRVVSLPVVHGEAVVVRILDPSTAPTSPSDLGMSAPEHDALQAALSRAHGGILVTGPTGSGKSTTLYGALAHLNTGGDTIITIEDPVEYRVQGIKQMHVNPKAGITFANGLRSIMRADPDIIMIGEIRDNETAQIAVEAALTGHLVLSTLHTRDAPTAVTRLLEMGIEPFLLSSAIDCVVAQRLARRLCDDCKQATETPAAVMRDHGFDVSGDVTTYEPVGCSRCNDIGYRGRVAIFEVMTLDEEIRGLVLNRASADVIADAATRKGMRRLRDDGLEKIVAGITSPAEVARVTNAHA
jgi:type IV pilus assembly protein PilB